MFGYRAYQAVCGYYAGKEEALGQQMHKILSEVSLRPYGKTYSEIKAVIALHYTLQGDYNLFTQTCNSLQRQLRLLGDNKPPHLVVLIKLLKTTFNTSHRSKITRMQSLIDQLQLQNYPFFSPLAWISQDKDFLQRLNRAHKR